MYSPFEGTKPEQLFRKINIGRVVAPYRKFNSWQQICSKRDKSIKQSPEFQHNPFQAPQKNWAELHHFQQPLLQPYKLCHWKAQTEQEKKNW